MKKTLLIFIIIFSAIEIAEIFNVIKHTKTEGMIKLGFYFIMLFYMTLFLKKKTA